MRKSVTIYQNDDGTFAYEVCGHNSKGKKGKGDDEDYGEYEMYKPFKGMAKTFEEAVKKASKKMSSGKGFKEYVGE